ncbi:unnamed protein product [Echinostoma caproni]|uniref:Mucin-5AC-like n=1 Tax=Echinostoma caproni TaxID=27848 RepID=A0A183A593_9TREM|nr:unnamed protein product [Echinostoma caproni]
MMSNILKFLFISVCVSVIVAAAQDSQNCEEVIASTEVKSFVIKGAVSGCQYRVQTDSGKLVKVFVNETSGVKCVKVTSGTESDTLCSTGATKQFTSSAPVEVSADSSTTSSETTTVEAPTVSPEATKQPGETGDAEKPDENEPKGPDSQDPPQPETDTSPQKPSVGNAVQSQADTSTDAGEKGPQSNQNKAATNQDAENLKARPEEASDSVQHLRRSRDTSSTGASDDVTVYYVLARETPNCVDLDASTEEKSFVVKNTGSGCQYRVKSDTGKLVKVYVNKTSGISCVKVSSGGKSETLCPTGDTTQFESNEPIEVRADSESATSEASGTSSSGQETTPAATEAPTTPQATEAPTTPQATEAPTTPQATEAPTTPQATEAPTTPQATEAPTTPQATEAPTTPQATEAPTTPQATEAPTTPQATEAPTTPQATEAPTTPQASEAPTTPQATEAPTTPQASEAPPTPKATEAPTTPKATEAPTTSQATESPPASGGSQTAESQQPDALRLLKEEADSIPKEQKSNGTMLLRRARSTFTGDRSNDVIVYYILSELPAVAATVLLLTQ